MLCGAGLAPFIFNQLDIWHAQGIWIQGWIMVAFSTTFFIKPYPVKITNIPFGLLHLWVGLLTFYVCYIGQIKKTYSPNTFFPYFNFLCLVILYWIVVNYLTMFGIKRILEGLRWLVLGTMGICVLQAFDLFRIMTLYHPENPYLTNIVVGIIGNGTLLSGFLTFLLPVFLTKINRENVLAIILMFLLLFRCGTSENDPSIMGFVVFFSILAIYLWKKYKYGKYFVLSFFAFLGLLLWGFAKEDPVIKFFGMNGRQEWLPYYWNIFKVQITPIGVGLGKINWLHEHTPFPGLKRLHLEYFQVMFETGFIGVILLLNVIVHFFKQQDVDEIQFYLRLIIAGFLISCFFNSMAHLWIVAAIAMFVYASYFNIQNSYKTSRLG
jgi:hypothetical protein